MTATVTEMTASSVSAAGPDPTSTEPAEALADGPAAEQEPSGTGGFEVHLGNFEGPFDLLLSLIAKHKLDITEVSLATVTDEFIAYVKKGASEKTSDGGQGVWDLEQTSNFLLVASTLLDLKAARLLPQGDVEDEDDLALLEARDLLFARLLQYKAFKQVAAVFGERLAKESKRHPRSVQLEPRYAGLLPEVLIGIGLEQFAQLAAAAMAPKPGPPEIGLSHIHGSKVSVKEQAALVIERLRAGGQVTFRGLCADSPDTLTTVARFLSLLELFREGAVTFDQVTALGELTVRWTGEEALDVDDLIQDEFEGQPPAESGGGPAADGEADEVVDDVVGGAAEDEADGVPENGERADD